MGPAAPRGPDDVKGLALEAVVRRVPAEVLIVDAASGRILHANALVQRNTLRNFDTPVPPDLRGDFQIFHPDGQPYAVDEWPIVRSMTTGEEVLDEEYFVVLPDGTRVIKASSTFPVYDEGGRIVAGIATDHDITTQKRTEEQLTFLSRLLEAIPDAVIAVDADLNVTAWNRGAEAVYGWKADEVLGRSVRDVIRSEMSSADRDVLRAQTREHGRTRAETVAYRKDGTPFDVELIHVAVRDEHGRLTGYVAINRNISEHKQAREQLAYHASLLENLHDAVIATDENFVVTAWNKGAEELYGWTADEALGRPAHEMVRAQYSDAGLADALRQLNETGSRRAETVVLHRDGTPVPIEAVTIALRDERGDVTGYLGINRDITERRRAEEQRARAEEKLREVRETERQRIARDLHDEALQELTHALAVAQGARAGATESAENDALLSALKRMGQQLRSAIYDLRLEEEESRPFPDRLAALVPLRGTMAVGHRVQLDRPKELPGDPFGRVGTELIRIVGEALTNAGRHAGAGNIRVRTWTSGRRLFVEVADDGRGFDPEGEPGAPDARGIRGMRERAGLIGADLEIRSGPGAGTTVRVGLTLAGDTGPLQPVRILLVEDHVAVREAIAATLAREADFEVTGEAASLAEARRMLDHVDVAVVDLRVADGYGWDLIDELRAANPEAQALVLTASVDRADIARAIESGAAGVLNKAAALDKVVEAVRRLRAGEALLPMTEVVELLHFAGRQRRQEHDDRQAIGRLTPREREVLQALARGLDSQRIAERLHITVRTERNHVASILAKLGVHSRLQALVFAMRYQLVEIP